MNHSLVYVDFVLYFSVVEVANKDYLLLDSVMAVLIHFMYVSYSKYAGKIIHCIKV